MSSMTNLLDKGLDETLGKLWATAYNRGLDHKDGIYYSVNDNNKIKNKARTTIKALVPEKKVENSEGTSQYEAYMMGYNQAIEEMLRRLSGDG